MLFGVRKRPGPGRRRQVPWRRVRPHVEALEDRRLLSVNFVFDFSHDLNNFFDTQAKRDLLQLAGQTLTGRLGDTLTAITPSGSNTWSAMFDDPATGALDTLTDLSIPQDTIIVYAGGRALGGSGDVVGEGESGGFSASGTQGWLNTVQGRGQAGALGPAGSQTDFAPAVGAVTFDTGTDWYFGTTTSGLGSSQIDFLSVALHELGHVLGVGGSNSWQNHVTVSDTFTGPAAEASYSGPVPLAPDGAHWAQTDLSNGQVPVMTPTILGGTRRQFTDLDWAGLQDVGWQVTAATLAPGVTVQATAGLTTTEAGGTATFTVVLNTVPTADVTISLSSSNPGAGTVSPALLTFTPGDALVPQTVTVTGVDDGPVQGNVSYTIVTQPAVSGDPAYNGLDPADVSVTNLETDPLPQPTPNPVGLIDATALVQVTRGPVKRHGKLCRQTVTLTNRGADPLPGPLTLVLVGLSRKTRLVGQAAGDPYVDVAIDALLPGASVPVVLNFRAPGSQRLRYGWVVLSGAGMA